MIKKPPTFGGVIAPSAERAELRKQLGKGVRDGTLDTILALRHPGPVLADPTTGRPAIPDAQTIIARQTNRRAAIADLVNALLLEHPRADYDSRFALAQRRAPELFR